MKQTPGNGFKCVRVLDFWYSVFSFWSAYWKRQSQGVPLPVPKMFGKRSNSPVAI